MADGGRGFTLRDGPALYRDLRFIDPTSLEGLSVPTRQWIIEGWLPFGTVTLSYGDGGVGKTLLAQQLMTSCATGVPWCGLLAQRCPVLGLFCEDDEDELHRRQADINTHFGLSFADLSEMRFASGAGEDNVLIRFDADGAPSMTTRFSDLASQAVAFGARLVIIDTAADTFAGNENDRAQVRQYVGNALTRLARNIGGAVLVNAHPSRSGLSAGGSMDSGSTGWSNSARSRWALTRPEAQEGETVDPNERLLTRRKANYATIGDDIKLVWRNGLLLPTATGIAASPYAGANRRAEIEAVFLTLLTRAAAQGRPMNTSRNAGNYAPAIFAKAPDRKGVSKREFEFAMESLLAAGAILAEQYGPPSKRMTRLALAQSDEVEAA